MTNETAQAIMLILGISVGLNFATLCYFAGKRQ